MSFVSKKQYRLMVALLPEMKEEDRKIGGVGVLVVHPDTGHVLVGKCTKTNQWTTPGGHVEEGESPREAAARELKEETGISVDPDHLSEKHQNGDSVVFTITHDGSGKKDTKELKELKFIDTEGLLANKAEIRTCCLPSLEHIQKNKLNKNIIRSGQVPQAVHELTHGDALKLVGTGMFRKLKNDVSDMKDDSIKEVKFAGYTLHIRKHVNDVYSGHIDDGLKTVHQFVNRSLPALTGELMSVFEWYSDDEVKPVPETELKVSVISDGMRKLINNYRSYNIADIYDEMEAIREEIRHGNARDLQQAEQKIVGLFDKLEEKLKFIQEKHNSLTRRTGSELDELEEKLKKLAERVQKLNEKKTGKSEPVEAMISDDAPSLGSVHSNFYPYLSKPQVSIHPSGMISIAFNSDWMDTEKENFLRDMKAKALKKGKK